MSYTNLLIVAMLCVGSNRAFSQATQVDLRTQSKDVDFGSAISTRPMKSGTVIPGTCNLGEMFFKQDAAAGSNLYACTSNLNQWTVESGGIGINDFKVAFISSSVLGLGGSCSVSTPCNARFGNTVYTFTSSATATITAGTGTAFIYLTGNGVLTIGHNLTVACSAGCLSLSGGGFVSAGFYSRGHLDGVKRRLGECVVAWMYGPFKARKRVVPNLGLTSASAAGQTSLSARHRLSWP